MKIISFLLAILVHLIIITVYLIFIQNHSIHKETKKVYTVDILEIKHQAKKELSKGKKDKKSVLHTEKKKQKKVKPKPKPKPKPKLKPKKTKKVKPKKIIKKTTKNKKKIEELKKQLVEQKKKLLKQKLIEEKKRQEEEKKIQERLQKRITQLKQEAAKQKNKQDADNKNNNGNADKIAHEYQTLINSIIHQNWGVEKSLIKTKHFSTTVDIKLDFRGNLIYIQILKNSGSVYFDGTVINAIKNSEPFPAPPKDIVENGIVEFIITFNSEEKE